MHLLGTVNERTTIGVIFRNPFAHLIFLVLSIRIKISASPILSPELQAQEYLQKYGYIKESSGKTMPLREERVLSSAIQDFQNFAGLEETGQLDNATLSLMSMPRCGYPDKFERRDAVMSRYILRSKWETKSLTYRISKYSREIKDKQLVDKEIARAFKVWSDVSQLRFSKSKLGKANIQLRFQKRKHGDGDSFDGPGGTLAHALEPNGGGDVCFDDDERWTVNQYRGTNLFQVAAHEIGHSLGLGHSKVKNSLMYPLYQGYQPRFRLDKDDIKGIQKLYGM